MLPIHLSIKYVSSLPSSLSCHHVMAAVIMVLLFSSHCRGVIIFVLHRCGVVSIIVLLCCLCCCCCLVVSVYGPGHHRCHTWPTLGFALAHPVHPGYPPCGWPRTLYLPSSLCRHCRIVAMLCRVMSLSHCHHVMSHHHCVVVVIALSPCHVASSPCCVASSPCCVASSPCLRRCCIVTVSSLLSSSHHHRVIVVVIASSPCCVVSSLPCCVVLLSHCCHITSLSLLLHCCHCCIVVVVALLQLLHGEHGAAGPRAGTGGSYSIAWDAAAIVGECR